jgi:hypothetical protein
MTPFPFSPPLKCMKTLVTNSKKAALVRFLTVTIDSEYTSGDIDLYRQGRVTDYLSKSLNNMHSLSDLRILRSHGNGLRMKKLDKILRSVYEILIFSKLTILLAIQSRSFSITNSLLSESRLIQHFSNH